MKKITLGYYSGAVAITLLLANITLAQALPPAQGTVPQQGWADPAFQALWTRNDKPVADGAVQRSWSWGPAPNATLHEALGPGLDNVLVQYTDKARMELPNPNADKNSQWYVTTGLLVKEMVTGQRYSNQMNPVQPQPAQINVVGDASDSNAPTYASFTNNLGATGDRTGQEVDQNIARDGKVSPHQTPTQANLPRPKFAYYEPATGHNIADIFWSFLNQTGKVYQNGSLVDAPLFNWVYVMGYPISEPYWSVVTVGGNVHIVIVQLFERRSLSYDLGEPNPLWQVQMGNVGQHYYAWRYGKVMPSPMPKPATAQPEPIQPDAIQGNDNFTSIASNQFYRRSN